MVLIRPRLVITSSDIDRTVKNRVFNHFGCPYEVMVSA
ncbi:hypothetical protein AB91_0320 [Escherichia coli 2-460-02_S3_C1]|nr:hypothetical protein ECSTECS1191_0214 [Escherichia coli STEC_S1191]EHV51094.1 hypothetical protein ECDEC6A_5133 [Escherichia coli DEC6A]KDY55121.1 hypothetical protein AB91_0320 [Escherichia coli 2-460-02_S3_C1]KDY65151.1 hypothetical protein AC20_0326 [Escherichia coli 2-460-02_S3_C2]